MKATKKVTKKVLLAVQALSSIALLAGFGMQGAIGAGPGDVQVAAGDYKNEGGTKDGGTGERSGSMVDDSVITAKVKSALISDKDVKAREIIVTTRKGEVVLSGMVENQNQVDRAVQIASNVEGVKNVSNRLTVKR